MSKIKNKFDHPSEYSEDANERQPPANIATSGTSSVTPVSTTAVPEQRNFSRAGAVVLSVSNNTIPEQPQQNSK